MPVPPGAARVGMAEAISAPAAPSPPAAPATAASVVRMCFGFIGREGGRADERRRA